MTIQASLKTQFDLALQPDIVYALLRDVGHTGRCLPDVEQIRAVTTDTFEWLLVERRVFGTTFKGHYVARYAFDDEHISWTTVEGNMANRGSFTLERRASGVGLTVEMHNDLPLAVPSLARPAIQMVIQQKMALGIMQMVRYIEASGRGTGNSI